MQLTTRRESFCGDDSGQILLLTVLSLTALLGVGALVLDASFMYGKRNRLSAAADAAAKSAGIEMFRNAGVTQASLEAFADQQVSAHGFTPQRSGGTTAVVVNRGPSMGAFAGNANYVEVIVSEATSTFFASVLGLTSMTPGARAVAGLTSSGACLIVLGTGTTALSIGNTTIDMPGCTVEDGGNLETTNINADINASSISVGGTCTGTGCPNMGNMQTGVLTPPTDPLAGLPSPANPGSCSAVTPTVGSTLSPGCYSNITFPLKGSYALDPGIYYMTGPMLLDATGVILSGTGVMFYFSGSAATGPCVVGVTAGCISVGNNAELHLSAPTSGTYTGILMFQDPLNHLNVDFYGNNPEYDLQGALYLPGADVYFRNGLGYTTTCMLLVARTFFINNGNGSFSNSCPGFGGSPIKSSGIVE